MIFLGTADYADYADFGFFGKYESWEAATTGDSLNRALYQMPDSQTFCLH